jgi:hypothetical protein
MHYTDLVQRTQSLPAGRHTIYELPDGRVEIRNVGQRHDHLAPQAEFRLYMSVDGREMAPRQGDFFSDFLLKIEARPDLRLPLTEASEQVCNGMSPQGMITSKRLPARFSEVGDATWTMQTSRDQTSGLPTDILLCGLQGLIRVYELNKFFDNVPEQFRQAFLGLEKGKPLNEVVAGLKPLVRPAKRYFNRVQR